MVFVLSLLFIFVLVFLLLLFFLFLVLFSFPTFWIVWRLPRFIFGTILDVCDCLSSRMCTLIRWIWCMPTTNLQDQSQLRSVGSIICSKSLTTIANNIKTVLLRRTTRESSTYNYKQNRFTLSLGAFISVPTIRFMFLVFLATHLCN